jgi:hypothetical protein
MTSTTKTQACWTCGAERDLRDLLVITDRHVERPSWYCCRPTSPGPHGDCVRAAAGCAADYNVAPAIPDLPRPPSVPLAAPVHDVVYRTGR